MIMRLGVGVISNRDWKPRFGISLVMLLNYLGQQGVKGRKLADIGFFPRVNCSLPPKGRRLVFEDAVKNECTHLLCLDDDMMFPPDLMDYFARGIDDHAMVCANYQNKSVRGQPVAVKISDEGRRFVPSKDRTGQEDVDLCGFGVVLLDIAKVNLLPRPLFAVPWLPNIGTEFGEDYFFCENLRKTGQSIALDHDVSNWVKHIGDAELDVV